LILPDDASFTHEVYSLSTLAIIPIPKLGPYLAGIIEGDGDISVPTKPRTPCGSINYGRISIAFAIADLELAKVIQSIVGGSIQFRRGTSCHLHVKGKGVLLLINLINGYFRTPKIDALHRLILWYNGYYGTNIALMPLDNSPLVSNAWLSGFIDADGSFYIH